LEEGPPSPTRWGLRGRGKRRGKSIFWVNSDSGQNWPEAAAQRNYFGGKKKKQNGRKGENF